MALFNRRAVVRVGDAEFSDLRVRFDVTRSLARADNRAEVALWNLATTTRATIAAAGRVPVLILAGYAGETPAAVFAGVLDRVAVRRELADVALVLSAGDGVPPIRVARSHAPGTDKADVLEALLRDLAGAGLGRGNAGVALSALRGTSTGRAPTVVAADPAVALEALLAPEGLEASVQDGRLQITERGGAAPGRAVLLAASTGLIGRPERAERGRVRARSQILAGVAPGRLVRIESEVASETVRVESARWVGDLRGEEWEVEVEGAPVAS